MTDYGSGQFESNNPLVPAVTATGTLGANGVTASSTGGGIGVSATSDSSFGVGGGSDSGAGVGGSSNSGAGVFGQGNNGPGVYGYSYNSTGVYGQGGSYAPDGIPGVGVHAVGGAAAPTASPPPPGAAIFAEGGPNFGVYATAGPQVSEIVSSEQVGQGLAIYATNVSGTAIQAQGMYSDAISIGVLQVENPQLIMGMCIQAINQNPQLAIQASSAGASDCIEGISGSGSGVVGYTGGAFRGTGSSSGVYGKTFTASGFGVTADGGYYAGHDAGVALQVINGPIQVGYAAGSTTIPAGTTTWEVAHPAVTADSLILLTPYGNPDAFLWISARGAASFTIAASQAVSTAVLIQFLIIN
jgi:hypothetical protein